MGVCHSFLGKEWAEKRANNVTVNPPWPRACREAWRSGAAAGPEQIGDVAFIGQVLDGFEAKGLRGAVDDAKQRLGGSGVAVMVAVNDGRASVAVGVTDDLTAKHNAVDLLRKAVAALGGQGGGGRPDMAQGGGPDGTKGAEALQAVRDALAG